LNPVAYDDGDPVVATIVSLKFTPWPCCGNLFWFGGTTRHPDLSGAVNDRGDAVSILRAMLKVADVAL